MKSLAISVRTADSATGSVDSEMLSDSDRVSVRFGLAAAETAVTSSPPNFEAADFSPHLATLSVVVIVLLML